MVRVRRFLAGGALKKKGQLVQMNQLTPTSIVRATRLNGGFLRVWMVGGTVIEPVTPTIST